MVDSYLLIDEAMMTEQGEKCFVYAGSITRPYEREATRVLPPALPPAGKRNFRERKTRRHDT